MQRVRRTIRSLVGMLVVLLLLCSGCVCARTRSFTLSEARRVIHTIEPGDSILDELPEDAIVSWLGVWDGAYVPVAGGQFRIECLYGRLDERASALITRVGIGEELHVSKDHVEWTGAMFAVLLPGNFDMAGPAFRKIYSEVPFVWSGPYAGRDSLPGIQYTKFSPVRVVLDPEASTPKIKLWKTR